MWKKIILYIVLLIGLLIVIDFVSIYTKGEPLFFIDTEETSANKKYVGILYDTYDCLIYSVPQVRFKWTKYNCDESKMEKSFKVSIEKSNNEDLIKAGTISDKKNNYSIYYYGLSRAIININNHNYDFYEAISENKIGLEVVLADLTIAAKVWDGGTIIYRDGGTRKYAVSTYTILKCNTLDGNNDLYIGDENMEYEDDFCK